MPFSSHDWITVSRVEGVYGDQQAADVRSLLADAGFAAELLSREAPAPVLIAWEVRVPASEAERAQRFLAANEAAAVEEELANAEDLQDPVSVFSNNAPTGRSEALIIQGVLRTEGIRSKVVPGFQCDPLELELSQIQVLVDRTDLDRARQAIVEAIHLGPTAVEVQ